MRPWARWFARITDYWLAGVFVGFGVAFVAPSLLEDANTILLSIPVVFLCMFLEALLLSTWGTTPGKWLLGIRVRSHERRRLDLSSALRRSFAVWVYGVGLGLPLIPLWTMSRAYADLRGTGTTAWDAAGGYLVSHRRIGALQLLLLVALWVGFLYLQVLGS